MELFYCIFPGIAEMPNIHPLLVHFPIALINAFLLTEILGLLTGKEEPRTAECFPKSGRPFILLWHL